MNKLPIAERFHSIQGEGLFTGTPMHFVRTAGCTVGRKMTSGKATEDSAIPILKTGKPAWQCHAYNGEAFWCDTDFNKYEEATVDQIIAETKEKHICLTGGEPLMHQAILPELIEEALVRGIQIHIETSGTIDIINNPGGLRPWITVSPKQGFLDCMIRKADEIKLLVGHEFDPSKIPDIIRKHHLVWLQPINDELTVDQASLRVVLAALQANPQWRLSVQLHKFLGVR